MNKIIYKAFTLLIIVIIYGCDYTSSNFVALRFEKYNFALWIALTSVAEVKIKGNLKSELDEGRIFKLTGDGEVVTSNHSIVIKGNTLLIDGKKTINMTNKPPYNMVLKSNGEVIKGYLRTFD